MLEIFVLVLLIIFLLLFSITKFNIEKEFFEGIKKGFEVIKSD